MLTLEQVVKKLADRNLKKVSEAVGLNHAGVCKLVKHPSYRVEYGTVKKLSDYIEEQERGE